MNTKEKYPQQYWYFTRDSWSQLKKTTDLHLGQKDLNAISGLADPIDMEEINTIYKPLCALLQIRYEAYLNLLRKQKNFFNENSNHTINIDTPYVIAIAGSVSVGKSSVARLLQTMLQQLPSKPRVELVTTDGFLHPNKYLSAHNIMDKKGFPISYNMPLLHQFLHDIKSGKTNISIPQYSHVEYDILKNQEQIVKNPNILIIEGLNVLQPALGKNNQILTDFFNFSIYIDAAYDNLEEWYVERFLHLRETAFKLENSYFKNYANLDDNEAIDKAKDIWKTINLKNLKENIEKTRTRATTIIHKGKNHKVENILLRKP